MDRTEATELVYKRHCELLVEATCAALRRDGKGSMRVAAVASQVEAVLVKWQDLSPAIKNVWVETVNHAIDVVNTTR
jgi:hypothetical protein